ncbi:hypothetical protein ACFLVG_00565 [Chloroflexota bacterium]
MSRTVFVLGAGASAHCGTPLMGNFLEVAQDLLRLGEVEEVKEDFENVFNAVGSLHAIQSKARINTYNIEDVYAAFEMGKLLGSLPGVESDNIEALTGSIKKVIAYTLERTTELKEHTRDTLIGPESYSKFADIIKSMIESDRDCTIMTFNYDLGLDYSLRERGISPDYSFGDIDLADKKFVITYLKLHGSLNFGKCTKCGKITPYSDFSNLITKRGADYSTMQFISRLKKQKCKYCGEPLEEDPFIVPPTWNKTAYHTEIDQVWKRAARELRDAENIFVLGYSLPSSDLFFHYLFALGVDMRTILKGFYVYNTDDTAEERFRDLLGSGIMQRFHFYESSFEEAFAGYTRISGPDYKKITQILDIQ